MDFPNFGSCCQWNTVTPSKRCGCKLVCMSERGRWERSEEEEEEEEEEDEEEHFNVLVKKLVANPSPLWHSHHRWRQLAISPCSTLCSFLANWQPSVPSVRAESGKGERNSRGEWNLHSKRTVTRHLGLCMCHVQTQCSGVTVQDVTIIGGMTYCIVGNFREKTFTNFEVLWIFTKVFSLKLRVGCPLAALVSNLRNLNFHQFTSFLCKFPTIRY